EMYPNKTDQPAMYAVFSPKDRNTKMNPPPVSGIAAASSAYVKPIKITSNPPIINAVILPKKPALEIHSPDRTTQPHPSMAPIAKNKTSKMDIDFLKFPLTKQIPPCYLRVLTFC